MDQPLQHPNLAQYLDSLVPTRNEELQKMETYAAEQGFPIVGPASGYFCYMIAKMIKATSVFELGSGYGYSTAWFARAVVENGGGTVVHVVWDEDLSARARVHLANLGYEDVIRYRVGEAVAALEDTVGQFNVIFNDIDKTGYPKSLAAIDEKLKVGGVLIVDNLLWSGKIFDESDKSPETEAIREFTRMMTNDPKWVTTIVPIRDGLLVALKTA